jgi:hypothetical protein
MFLRRGKPQINETADTESVDAEAHLHYLPADTAQHFECLNI